MVIANIELSNIRDGIYGWECVLSLIKDNQIEEVNILEHQNGFGKKEVKFYDQNSNII